jgi:hypothetical protein
MCTGDNACREANIFCPSPSGCTVQCTGDTACLDATIESASDLSLDCGDNQNGCRNTDVSCPNTKVLARNCDGNQDSPMATELTILEAPTDESATTMFEDAPRRLLEVEDLRQSVHAHRRRLLDAIEEPSELNTILYYTVLYYTILYYTIYSILYYTICGDAVPKRFLRLSM